MSLLKITDLTLGYDSTVVVKDLNFTVDPGDYLCILGENGAGKSTLMKIITCFIPPTSGTVSVEGHDVMDDPMAVKRIGQLSKGYRQRVGLAQALIHDPQVLILDEPTTGLDPNQLEEIRTVIKNAGHDKVVLLSTHIMQEVEAMCSRAIIINHGRIVSDDHLTHITSQQLTEKFHRVTAE